MLELVQDNMKSKATTLIAAFDSGSVAIFAT